MLRDMHMISQEHVTGLVVLPTEQGEYMKKDSYSHPLIPIGQ